MPQERDFGLFVLTLAAAAAVLVSIAGAETLLAIACGAWIIYRPRPITLPSYFVPLCAFMATTAISLIMSPQPAMGRAAIYKFWLFAMGFLAANTITSSRRARQALLTLLIVSAVTSGLGLIQFVQKYLYYLTTQSVGDDPMINGRITGFMGHWLTYSNEQLLVWCAAIPAMLILGRRWMILLGVVGASLVLSFTRGVWLGAIAGFLVIVAMIPRKVWLGVAIPVAVVCLASSGLILHRISTSLQPNFAPNTGRVELFFAGVQMIEDHPLFGVGPQRIHTEFPKYYRGPDLEATHFYYGHLENNILQLAAERGLPCLAAFLWFIFELYAGLIDVARKSDSESRWTALSALAALTGFFVAGSAGFQYNFGDSEVLLLLLFIVSLPFGIRRTVPVEEPCPTDLVTAN
jgi:O-antigen ligase